MKLIFITGWTISGLWKGITSASIARLLVSANKKINMIKMDPYLQVDAWTMSPYEHWEVFVTDDWWETDLDLGNYERFTNLSLTKDNNITTWKIYLNVISKEREWKYLWKTVQIIPHITDEIKNSILKIAKNSEITLVEVWWTVWDIESQPFLEAIRQLKLELGKQNIIYVHVAPLLYLPFSWETKTKPIQHSVKQLMSFGIIPDILVARTEKSMTSEIRKKISLLCDIVEENIIEAKNAKTIYEVPELFAKQNLDKIILNHFWYKKEKSNLISWNKLVKKIISPKNKINIAIIWKYTQFLDTYKSIWEALIHAWVANDTKVITNWISSENLSLKDLEEFQKQGKIDAILIPWGFWERWIEWKILAVNFARTKKIPFLWICLGLQVSVIEFARNVCGLKNANSREFDENAKYKVIDFMEEQKNITKKWATMRLWAYKAKLKKWSLAEKLYKPHPNPLLRSNFENSRASTPVSVILQGEGTYEELIISERHRHRYEVNPEFYDILEKNWLIISWTSLDSKLVEFIELKNHPYFIATQAHPEFKSRLKKAHPLFDWLIKAGLKNKI